MAQIQEEIPVEQVGTGIPSTQKYDAAQIDKLEGLEAVISATNWRLLCRQAHYIVVRPMVLPPWILAA